MALMYSRVVDVITRPPQQRQEHMVEQLLPWFRKKAELFQSINTEVMKDIVRNCSFSTRPPGNVIIRQGDKGDCFYIILSGTVSIYVNLQPNEDDQQDDVKTPRSTESLTNGHISIKDLKRNSVDGTVDRTALGNFITVLGPGQSFGEIALISVECVRNASIIADEFTDLVEVNSDLYNRSLRAFQQQEFQERTDFVDTCRWFAKWQRRFRKQMAITLRRETLSFNSFIVRQGDPVNALYFLIRGQVKVVTNTKQLQTQYPKLSQRMEEDAMVQNNGDTKPHIRKRETPSQRLKKHRLQRTSSRKGVCLLGPGDTIGDIELCANLSSHMSSVECIQSTEVFVLDLKAYERLIVKRNPPTLDLLCRDAMIKVDYRLGRWDYTSVFCQGLKERLAGKVTTNEVEKQAPEKIKSLMDMKKLKRFILPRVSTFRIPDNTKFGISSVDGLQNSDSKQFPPISQLNPYSKTLAYTGNTSEEQNNDFGTFEMKANAEDDNVPPAVLHLADNGRIDVTKEHQTLTNLEDRLHSWLEDLQFQAPLVGKRPLVKLKRIDTTVIDEKRIKKPDGPPKQSLAQ